MELFIVLLGGGSGKRLWPLSNDIRSKPFLRLLPGPDGKRESMIQRICRQLGQAGMLPFVTMVAHQRQVEIIQHHVGTRVPILAEPQRRGTFPAVALAASHLHSRLQVGPDETVCIMPIDAYVEPNFYACLRQLPEILARSGAELAMIGTVPHRPSSQYGYIVPAADAGDAQAPYYRVSRFVEKPDEKTAVGLMNEKAFWNCGVYAFRLSFMLSYLEGKGLPVQYERLLECYPSFPETSFDEEIAEKTRHAVVVPYRRTWRDLGDWNTLSDSLGCRIIGPGHLSGDARQTHLINELPHPIHVIGISNAIVAAGPDGILVARKDQANRIKELLDDRQPEPMYVEKRWGTFRVLDYARTATETLTKKVELLPGKSTSYHLHRRRTEICTILSGFGKFILEGAQRSVRPGDVLHIPRGAKHSLKAVHPLEYIVVQIGNALMEEDVVRSAMTWEEAIGKLSAGGKS